MDPFQEILERHESWLKQRVLSRAEDSGNGAHPSDDDLPYCFSVAELSASLVHASSAPDQSRSTAREVTESFIARAALGYRKMNVSLGKVLAELKHYRREYLELLDQVDLHEHTRDKFRQAVNRGFDQVEIALCDQWFDRSFQAGEPQGSPNKPESRPEAVDVMSLERSAESALRESQQKLDSIVSSMTDHLVMVDDSFSIEWANNVAKNRFGSDMVGKKCYQVLCDELLQCHQCAIADCMADGDPHDREKTVVKPDGQTVHYWCTANVATRHDDGRPKTYLQILRDVTDLKRTQELLLETEGLRAVSELTSGVAHNFRNLLQVIMSAARLASMEMKDNNLEEADQALEQILRTSYFGAGTIKRIEEFARPSDDVRERPDEIFDLSLTVAQAVEMSKPWWKSKPQRVGTTVRMQRDLENGAWVKGQESQLFEVIVNLIRNAVEAFQSDSTIWIKTAVKEPKVLLTMEDNGPGIAPQHIPHVFQPFWTTKSGRGSGMGLATARKIVTEHRGAISVDSTPGKATRFTIELPLAQESVRVNEHIWRSEQRSSLKILVIDDVDQAATFMRKALQRIGHNVVSCVSGNAGLSEFDGGPFDAVLCDLCMPEMNGLEVGRRIKEKCEAQGNRKPVFILITGWADQELKPEEVSASGVDGVLEKPADLRCIQELIARLVEQRNALDTFRVS